MSRSMLALLLLASLALGAAGMYVHTHGPDPATTPLPPEFAAPPTPSAAPPPGARPHAWFLNTLHEARRDGILLVLAGILFVTTLVHVVSPAARRRIRTSVLCFFAYLVTMPVCGLLSPGVQLEAYGWVRTLAAQLRLRAGGAPRQDHQLLRADRVARAGASARPCAPRPERFS